MSPYRLSNKDCKEGQFGVINSDTGEQKGCSDSEDMAKMHMRALYANEKKEMDFMKTVEKVKSALSDAWKRISTDSVEPLQKDTGMMVWKDKATGQYRWFGTYSNSFRDKDKEIISEQSHKAYVDKVDKGLARYPVLMHWHEPAFTWGQADMVAYDDESKMAMASGYILPGHEKEAESFMKSKQKICMSHGFPKSSLRYAKDDSSVIIEHMTEEVSDLPAWAAANELTSFAIMDLNGNAKEASNMTISDAKKKYLIERGLTEEQIDTVLSANKSVSDEAVAEGIETKDTGTETVVAEVIAETPVVTDVVVETTPEVESIKETKTEPQLSAKDIADAVSETLKPFVEKLSGMQSELELLQTEVKQAKEAQLEQKEVDLTPSLSLGAMIAQTMSAIGKKEALVPGNAGLAKDKPEEEKPIDTNKTGDPMTDLVGRIISGKAIG